MDESSKAMIDNIGAAITVVGVFGGLCGAFFDWLGKRSIKAKYQDESNLAERRITFLNTWFSAQAPVCTPERLDEIKLETSKELDELRNRLARFIFESEQTQLLAKGKNFQRTFLLFIPHNIGGWICHILFYILLIFTLFSISLIPEVNDIQSWTSWLTGALMSIVIFGIPLFMLHSLAIRYNRRKN